MGDSNYPQIQSHMYGFPVQFCIIIDDGTLYAYNMEPNQPIIQL
jgi:hypothetical protein